MLGNDQNDPYAFVDADEPVKQPGLKGRKSHSGLFCSDVQCVPGMLTSVRSPRCVIGTADSRNVGNESSDIAIAHVLPRQGLTNVHFRTDTTVNVAFSLKQSF